MQGNSLYKFSGGMGGESLKILCPKPRERVGIEYRGQMQESSLSTHLLGLV